MSIGALNPNTKGQDIMTTTILEKSAKIAINGVDVPTFVATLGAVGNQPEIAKFTFRAKGAWLSGTHSRTEFSNFFGAMSEMEHKQTYTIDGDHPSVLCGGDNGVTPFEMVLAGLSACITAGIGNIASIRQIKLESVETTVESIQLVNVAGASTPETEVAIF